MTKRTQNRQGIAVISVLIVIALISASVSLMFQRFDRDLKQTQFIVTQTQALNHLYSIETWAKNILSSDDPSVDHLNEVWATSITPIQIPGGLVFGKLIDLQSKLNLNNLIDLETNQYSPQYRSFFYDCINLLNTQLQQQAMGDTIFSHLINQYPKPKSFEQVSEMKQIQSIVVEDYIKIKPLLSALPSLTAINVNTASKKVLSCLHPQLTVSMVNEVIQRRNKQEFTTIDDFWALSHSLLPHMTLDEIKENLPAKFVNTASDYFLLETDISFEENKLLGRTVLHRKDGKITIMNRSYNYSL
jgi:general secretion pathway protein K